MEYHMHIILCIPFHLLVFGTLDSEIMFGFCVNYMVTSHQYCILKLVPFPVKKSVIGQDLQAYAHGLWGLVPAFCRHPTDISKSFHSFAKLMLVRLKKDAFLLEDIAQSFQVRLHHFPKY